MEIDIDIDAIADEVRTYLDRDGFADDIADRVKDDLNIGEVADEVIESYAFDNAVYAVVNTALADSDLVSEIVGQAVERNVDDALEGIEDEIRTVVRDEIKVLGDRIATLEAALASAGTTMQEPARRVLHGVEVPATTTGLF